jgi:transcriptional regulator with XRE-family HTH domain
LEEGKQTAAFGRAIYLLRIKASLSQEELAFQSGVGRSYVGVLERFASSSSKNLIYLIPQEI